MDARAVRDCAGGAGEPAEPVQRGGRARSADQRPDLVRRNAARPAGSAPNRRCRRAPGREPRRGAARRRRAGRGRAAAVLRCARVRTGVDAGVDPLGVRSRPGQGAEALAIRRGERDRGRGGAHRRALGARQAGRLAQQQRAHDAAARLAELSPEIALDVLGAQDPGNRPRAGEICRPRGRRALREGLELLRHHDVERRAPRPPPSRHSPRTRATARATAGRSCRASE